jgi:hypothetical protein
MLSLAAGHRIGSLTVRSGLIHLDKQGEYDYQTSQVENYSEALA